MRTNYTEIIELCYRHDVRLELRSFSRVYRDICESVTLKYCPKCREYPTRQGMISNARKALKAEGHKGRFKLDSL